MAYIKYLPIYPYPAGNLLQHSKITWTTHVYIKLGMMVFKVEIPMLQYSTDHISTATNCILKPEIPSFEDPHIAAWMSLD
jgi:hypothetical protein